MGIPVPPGIRKVCLEDEDLFRRYGNVVTAYDPECSVGGMYNLIEKQWVMFYPISIESFADRVATVVSVMDTDKQAQKLIH